MNAPLIAPPVMYKYTMREFAESMMREGNIRLGTLHDFKRQEAYGDAIGDKEEGIRTTAISGDPNGVIHFKHLKTPNGIFKDLTATNCDNIYMSHEMSQDMYVYCVSSDKDRTIMEAFGCDACVQINNPAFFFAAIHFELMRRSLVDIRYGAMNGGYLVSPCQYISRHKLLSGKDMVNSPIAIIEKSRIPLEIQKPEGYDWQKEIRATWKPKNLPVAPFNLACEGIRSFIEIIPL